MKKIISVVLVLALVLAVSCPAFAKPNIFETQSSIPVIRISGDGDALYDKDGNKILKLSQIFTNIKPIYIDNGNIYETIANILQPYLIEGLLQDNFDNYYKALEQEIGKLFEQSRLDENGDPKNGSGISQSRKDNMQNSMNTDKKQGKGYYGVDDYKFYYDWRLDPWQTADEFNAFIKGIKNVTGADKVAIYSSCLGTSVAMAYVAKYGTDDIQGLGFNGSVVNGAEAVSDPVCGKFRLDGEAISRFLDDSAAIDLFEINEFARATINLLSKAGVFKTIDNYTRATVYDKVVKGVTSALALSTLFTWPTYWSAVLEEDYETAKEYIFGPEGSEKRIQYAGLIEKLDNYEENVRSKIPEILQCVKENGGNLAFMSKYGYQLFPNCESGDKISDQIASVERTSFGATTSNIYDTLDDEYIAQRVAEGKGKYISPDKQIDASTCLYPDYTWFTKGARHSNWTQGENMMMYTVLTADHQYTVDDFDMTQFMVYDNEAKTTSPMTVQNCDTYYCEAEKGAVEPENVFEKSFYLIKSALRWVVTLFKTIFNAISGK